MEDSGCVFCKILQDSSSKYFMESNLTFAISDINPITKGHTLIIPKKHFSDLGSTADEYLREVIVMAKNVSIKLKDMYPDIKGFNFVSNQGKEAKQVIFHLHLHIIPRY